MPWSQQKKSVSERKTIICQWETKTSIVCPVVNILLELFHSVTQSACSRDWLMKCNRLQGSFEIVSICDGWLYTHVYPTFVQKACCTLDILYIFDKTKTDPADILDKKTTAYQGDTAKSNTLFKKTHTPSQWHGWGHMMTWNHNTKEQLTDGKA